MKYIEDKGMQFGLWQDKVSRLMYYQSTKKILSKIAIPEIVADYGGANGVLKKFIPNSISIDIDASKNPDIVGDIITHQGQYDLIVIRYVLHYLNDMQIIELFDNISTYHKGAIMVQQFCNENLLAKYRNSQKAKECKKYFRTQAQLAALLPSNGRMIYKKSYIVDEDFYINRLGLRDAIPHNETIIGYYYENK